MTSHCVRITLAKVIREIKDSQWSDDHVARHGVTLDEVREAVLERPYLRAKGRGGSILVYGRTYEGRYLLVVVNDDDEEAFIVTARDMNAGEKKLFNKKAR